MARRSLGALVVGALLVNPASADSGRAPFKVIVNVPVRVELETVQQPGLLTLTADDVARGYKDVSARYRVRHNDRNGYLLQIAPRLGLASEIRVAGLGGPVVVLGEPVELFRSGADFEQDLSLDFRFVLDAAARPGTFDLPVQVAALPL